MAQVYVGIGSNVERERSILAGLRALDEHFGPLQCSAVYQSQAVGFDGPDFYNLVALFETPLPLTELIAQIKAIELANGRARHTQKFSSRTLDIDLLLYDGLVCDTPCQLPRHEIEFNAFVLRPLAELAGELVHPTTHELLSQMWERLKPSAIDLKRVELSAHL
jgi:2-amino-4-hydroxy-6-hydroxymethyldihydropteridine diphosphokinase